MKPACWLALPLVLLPVLARAQPAAAPAAEAPLTPPPAPPPEAERRGAPEPMILPEPTWPSEETLPRISEQGRPPSTPSATTAGGRIIVEILAGALGEAVLGYGGMLIGEACCGINNPNGLTAILAVGSLGAIAGAGLGAGLGGLVTGGSSSGVGPALLGSLLASLLALPLIIVAAPLAPLALLFPLTGAVLGYELAQPPAAPSATRQGVANGPRALPAVSLAPGGAGAVWVLAGTF